MLKNEYIHAHNLPKNREDILTKEEIMNKLKPLLGTEFPLSGKPRTDGTNLRKLISHSLGLGFDKKSIKAITNEKEFSIKKVKSNNKLTKEKKGIPKIRKQLMFTYLATPPYENNDCYNLQIWNYNPQFGEKPVMFDEEGEILFCFDEVRIVIGWVNNLTEKIESFTVMTFKELKETFGTFGKETVKYQMVLDKRYKQHLPCTNNVFVGKEYLNIEENNNKHILNKIKEKQRTNKKYFKEEPKKEDLFSLKYIQEKVSKELIGKKVEEGDTKNSGQTLERYVLKALGYEIPENLSLDGSFPDIRNQLLEVKLQNKQTVNLGQYSPTSNKKMNEDSVFNFKEMRYLIAITDKNNIIKEVILIYGKELIRWFHFVPEKNFKCQKMIKLDKLYTSYINQITYSNNGKLTVFEKN